MTTVLRAVCVGLGLVLIGATFLVYENEEREIQSRLETLWIRLSDYGAHLYTRHSGVSTSILRAVAVIVDKLFGPKIFSRRFLAASVSISSIGALFSYQTITDLQWSDEKVLVLQAAVLFLGVFGIGACFWFGAIKSRHYLLVCLASLLVVDFVNCVSGYLNGGALDDPSDMTFQTCTILVFCLPASVCADFGTVWATRKIAQWGSSSKRLKTVASMLGIVLVAPLIPIASAALFLSPTLLLGGYGAAFGVLDVVNLLTMDATDALLFLVIALVAVSLALHSAIWPLILRPLYALQKDGWQKSCARVRAAEHTGEMLYKTDRRHGLHHRGEQLAFPALA